MGNVMQKNRKQLLHSLLPLSILLSLLNFTALKFHLYWTTWWMDVINHFLGGVIITIIFFVICLFADADFNPKKYFPKLILFAIAIGVLWEVFEVYFGLTFVDRQGYWQDTTLDMVMDMVGMFVTYRALINKAR